MKKLRQQPRSESGNIWLIIFSDITTNLMLFFLMLFAMSRMSEADRLKVKSGMESVLQSSAVRDQAERNREAKLAQENASVDRLRRELEGGGLGGQAQMTVQDKTIKIVLNPASFFSTGSTEITPETKRALEGLLPHLAAFPDDIIIEGHTDNVPIRGGGRFGSNWELSVARAVSVIDFFVSRGAPPERFVAGGYGEFHPAFPNDTPENQARNRRIEITIFRQPQEKK